MTSRARFLSSRSCARRFRIWARIMTSSAVVWLVGDQKRRVARQGHGDHDPLAHAAGELVRVVARPARRDAHVLEKLLHAAASFTSGDTLMKQDRLDDLVPDSPHRVERVHGPLEDHRYPGPAQRPQTPRFRAHHLRVQKADRPLDRGIARKKAKAGQRERALAAPRLPRKPQGAPRPEREVNAVHRRGSNAPYLIQDAQVLYLEQGCVSLVHLSRSLGSRISSKA